MSRFEQKIGFYTYRKVGVKMSFLGDFWSRKELFLSLGMLISRITHWPIDGHRDHAACGILVLDSWKRRGRSFDLYYF